MHKQSTENKHRAANAATDDQLVEHLRAGSETALRQLYDKYAADLYAVAFRFTKNQSDSEDIVQDVFIKLWNTRETLHATTRIWSFLYVITKHLAFNKLRQLKYQEKVDLHEAEPLEIASVNNYAADSYTNSREIVELENLVLEKLPRQQREVYVLSRQQGMTYQEISREMNISPNTVKNHLIQSLKSFKSYFRKFGYPFLILFFLLH